MTITVLQKGGFSTEKNRQLKWQKGTGGKISFCKNSQNGLIGCCFVGIRGNILNVFNYSLSSLVINSCKEFTGMKGPPGEGNHWGHWNVQACSCQIKTNRELECQSKKKKNLGELSGL